MALTGTALPLAYLINRRAAGSPSPEPQLVVRQALWVGIFGATLAWLQLGRLASMWVILGLAGGLIAAEYFVRMRELARRRPRFGDQAFASADRHDAAP
jgi:sterol desaturase/sphingolipid hydroxylase (fatty acid hydroxylase superfamily)